MKRVVSILIIVLMLVPQMVKSQVLMPHAWRNYLEQLSEDGEDEMVEDLQELFEEYCDNPLNVNDTVGCLRNLPFVDDFQRRCLRSYIMMYGPLVSVEELHLINGFDSLVIDLLRPLIVCQSIEEDNALTLKEILTKGHSNLVMGVGGTIEEARGYRDSIYEGDNLRLMWRYYFRYKDRVQLQLSGDKDPGEAFFSGSQPYGFDFYGFSLLLNDLGMRAKKMGKPYLKRAVIGQYHLQFGQGLTLWSGFGWHSSSGANICRYAQSIRPSGAFSEYGYLQGGAAVLSIARNWDLSLFYSYVNRAATLPRNADKDSTIDWVQSLYNSGYFRTQTEIKKKNQLVEQLAGGHLEYRTNDLRLGVTGALTWFDKDIIPATSVYNDNAFKGRWNSNAGVDLMYRHNRFVMFGEVGVCGNNALDSATYNISPAAVFGGEYMVNNNHRISAQMRYYSPNYHALHANALGQSSSPQNEIGAALYYQGQLPWGIVANVMADCFYFPHMKYLVYAPSRGEELRVMLSRASRTIEGFSVNVRYRFKEKGRNITPSTMVDGAYLLEQTYRHQVQGDIEYGIGPWKFVSRLGYAYYHGDKTLGSGGFLFYQDVQFHPQRIPLTLTARVALFDVDDYEARLYTVESDFIYQYNSYSYQNEGYRCYLVARYDISRNWNIGFKYGVTAYSDRDNFGSGYELIDANHRQQWRIQIRFKW